MIVFYDGECAMCHGFVRFVLRHGPADIRFAPADGQRTGTIIVQLEDGSQLVRSEAVLAVLQRCGQGWRWLAVALHWIPRWLRDVVYNSVAAIRYRLAGRAAQWCPAVPAELQHRFLRRDEDPAPKV